MAKRNPDTQSINSKKKWKGAGQRQVRKKEGSLKWELLGKKAKSKKGVFPREGGYKG